MDEAECKSTTDGIGSGQRFAPRSDSGWAIAGAILRMLFAVAWCSFAAFTTVMVARTLWEQRDANQRFISTSAVVVMSNLETSIGRKGGMSYRPVIRYSYTVGGMKYAGSTIELGGIESTSNRKWAENFLARYGKGADITIFYDPRRPDRSALRVGMSGRSLLMAIFMQAFVVAGLSMLRAAVQSLAAILRARAFCARAFQLPCEIPGWGDASGGAFELTITAKRPSLRLAVMFLNVYGGICAIPLLTCLVLYDGMVETPEIAWTFPVALIIGLVAVLLKVVMEKPLPIVRVDLRRGEITINDGVDTRSIDTSNVICWGVRRVVKGGRSKYSYAQLVAVMADGSDLLLHKFTQTGLCRLAWHVARALARLTDRPVANPS